MLLLESDIDQIKNWKFKLIKTSNRVQNTIFSMYYTQQRKKRPIQYKIFKSNILYS